MTNMVDHSSKLFKVDRAGTVLVNLKHHGLYLLLSDGHAKIAQDCHELVAVDLSRAVVIIFGLRRPMGPLASTISSCTHERVI
jgi:hypothetical protein